MMRPQEGNDDRMPLRQQLERDGKVNIEKTCPRHGTFTDVLSINPEFSRRIEGLFPGRDYAAVTDHLHVSRSLDGRGRLGPFLKY